MFESVPDGAEGPGVSRETGTPTGCRDSAGDVVVARKLPGFT